jgi:hypothetical protein
VHDLVFAEDAVAAVAHDGIVRLHKSQNMQHILWLHDVIFDNYRVRQYCPGLCPEWNGSFEDNLLHDIPSA